MPRLVPPTLAFLAALATAFGAGCAGESASPQPAWTGDFHPPGKPGGSITNFKQCECRACDPGSCCSAEKTENVGTAPAECNSSFTFSEKCGITVNTCTPRCYSHVWRIAKQESCDVSRPLVCCEG